MVRDYFAQALEGRMDLKELEELKGVFFKYTYPTPPVTILKDLEGVRNEL